LADSCACTGFSSPPACSCDCALVTGTSLITPVVAPISAIWFSCASKPVSDAGTSPASVSACNNFISKIFFNLHSFRMSSSDPRTPFTSTIASPGLTWASGCSAFQVTMTPSFLISVTRRRSPLRSTPTPSLAPSRRSTVITSKWPSCSAFVIMFGLWPTTSSPATASPPAVG